MDRQARCGISAPPEVVFNTATDPQRRAGWLPSGLGLDPVEVGPDAFEAQLSADGSAAGRLRVRPGDAGGALVELDLAADRGDAPQEILGNLERLVTDNLNAG